MVRHPNTENISESGDVDKYGVHIQKLVNKIYRTQKSRLGILDKQDLENEAWAVFFREKWRYNPEIGASFKTFISHWIWRHLLTFIREHSTPFSVSRHEFERHGDEVYHRLNSQKVLSIQPLIQNSRQEDYQPGTPEPEIKSDLLQNLENQEMLDAVRQSLSQRDYEILLLREGYGLNYRDIGKRYAISGYWTKRIIERSLEILRNISIVQSHQD